MNSYLLRENVLTDNVLLVSDKGKVFKGGYIAIVKENTFQNAWQDKESIKRFRNKTSLYKYLDKNYKEVVEEFDFYDTCLED